MNQKEEKPARNQNKKKFLILLILLLAVGGYFGVQWLLFRWHYVSTDDAQIKGNLINLSAKVSGRIIQLLVEEGDKVQAGQVLMKLEKKDYAAAEAQARAAAEAAKHELDRAITQLSLTKERVTNGVATAQASLQESRESLKFAQEDAALQADQVHKGIERAQANYQAAQAKVLEAKATLANAQKEYGRLQELFRQRYIPENARDAQETAWHVAQSQYQVALENVKDALSQLELAKANQQSITLKKQNIRIAEQGLERARINLALAEQEKKQILLQEKNIELLRAKMQEAESALHQAEIRLQETDIFSPISGVVAKRMADQGQMVQPGQSILVVFNPGDKWIVANVEETKIRRVCTGAKVRVEVDAFPGREFEGLVEFIGAAALSEFALLPADNPSGNYIKITHRLPVRITVRDPDNLLRPGMNVVAAIAAK
jgi:membrane fusion protein (multidrug efflux system)